MVKKKQKNTVIQKIKIKNTKMRYKYFTIQINKIK